MLLFSGLWSDAEMTRWLAVAVVLMSGCVETTFAKIRRDTYLTAYMESQGSSGLAPGEVYGSPALDYGAPVTMGYSYNAPAEAHTLPENPFEPLHSKLILVFKILLKVLVFKLIVKFLAIMCVLLFLPKLSDLGLTKEANDDARKLKEKGMVFRPTFSLLIYLSCKEDIEEHC